MHRYVEVVVPGPWWNTLTYSFDSDVSLIAGTRVRIPLGRGQRVGFVLRAGEPPPVLPKGLRNVKEVLDQESALGDELWGLASWIGKTFLCGMGEALQLICPKPLLQGEPLMSRSFCTSFSKEDRKKSAFREIPFYHPIDGERFAYYKERLSFGKRVMLLFPEVQAAAAFFSALSPNEREGVLLWPSTGGKKLWEAWRKVYSGEIRVVVGAGSAVFAPLPIDEIIVDDESNPAYIFLRAPRISARSLAGRRAFSAGAQFVLGGRMPSAKTYFRSSPKCEVQPLRRNFVLVDMARSFKPEVRGVEGGLPITKALIERTRNVLDEGRHVFWIMDRKGQAGEVTCSDCGDSFFCPRCSSIMRSQSGRNEAEGSILRCVKCGLNLPLPDRCPTCRGVLLLGKRPGLEALFPMAIRYLKGYSVLTGEVGKKRITSPSLILGTRGLLSFCDLFDVGLVAWLDLDAEARRIDYNARFQMFSMVWESYWRGLSFGGNAGESASKERVVLMQTHRPGSASLSAFWLGWQHFWETELKERRSLSLPPYGLLVQMDVPKGEDRAAFVRLLEEENFSVMDSGDEGSSLWISVGSTERLGSVLAPRFEIKHSRRGFPVLTVWAE